MSLSISQAARTVGLRPSAIRYYEHIGLLIPCARIAGQRRYDQAALQRLAVIQRARRLGFTLDEIRALFFDFPGGVPASPRWSALSRIKLDELDREIDNIKALQSLLRAQGHCECASLEDCGKFLLTASDCDRKD
ncbi:MAG: MerR family transcriptional regulator [Gemmatimonadales bacterium]